jgi:hypothetical protein
LRENLPVLEGDRVRSYACVLRANLWALLFLEKAEALARARVAPGVLIPLRLVVFSRFSSNQLAAFANRQFPRWATLAFAW